MSACTFIGHKDAPENIKPLLCETIEHLILYCNVDTFYVGTHGNFDRMVYEVLNVIETKYKIRTTVVLAYLNNGDDTPYYDRNKTVFPAELNKTPLRFAINKRNLYMIDKSDYMVCYVDNTFTNAFSFAQTAVKRKLNVINLGKVPLNE